MMKNGRPQADNLDRLEKAYRAAYWAAYGSAPTWNAAHLARRGAELLYGVETRQKRVLEIGAGDGFLSHYLAVVCGTTRVVSLDSYEGAGSMPQSYQVNLRAQDALGDAALVEIVRADFRKFLSSQQFDIIIFVNVMHHIISSGLRLSHNPEAFAESVSIFQRCRSMLSPAGCVLVQELGRINLCPFPKYRKAMAHVRWNTKQPAREWVAAINAAGLRVVSIRYRLPLNLPNLRLLRGIFNNPFAACFADSSYIIRAENAKDAA